MHFPKTRGTATDKPSIVKVTSDLVSSKSVRLNNKRSPSLSPETTGPGWDGTSKFIGIPLIYHIAWLIYEFFAIILFYKNKYLLKNETST